MLFTSVDKTGDHGVRRRMPGPYGSTYLLQAAPSGFVEWSYLTAQGPFGWATHVLSTRVVNRLIFQGGWTVVVWRGDDLAPKRRTVSKRRYPTRLAAVAALDELARSGPASA